MGTHPMRRRAVAVAVAAVLLVGAVQLVPHDAAAADPSPSPVALPTAQVDGVVWSQAASDDTVYVGGAFTTGTTLDGSTAPRPNLLAYDLRSGPIHHHL